MITFSLVYVRLFCRCSASVGAILHIYIYISQGSVATRFSCGGNFNIRFCRKFTGNCAVERILQIDQYLAKIGAYVTQWSSG